MALQIRRGTSSELLPNVGTGYPGIRLALGELVYTTDEQKLYIGDGTTYGGIDLLANMSGAVTKVNNLTGAVSLTTDEIPEGDALYYTASRAVAAVATELTDNNNLHDGISFTWAGNNLTATVTGEITTRIQKDVAPKLGGTLVLNTSLATTAASASGGTATITYSTQTVPPFVVGEEIFIAGVTPTDFNGGPYTVLTCSTTQVTFAKVGTLGPQTIAGTVFTNHGISGSGSLSLTGDITGTGNIQRTGDILLTGNFDNGTLTIKNGVVTSTNDSLFLTSGVSGVTIDGIKASNPIEGALIITRQSRGSAEIKAAVQSTDFISGFEPLAYNGNSFVPAGLIGFVQDGTAFNSSSSGIPTELNIALADTAGLNFDNALNFNNKGVLTAPVMRTTGYADSAARDAAITSPVGGMIVYLQDSGVFCGYNAFSSTWVVLG